MSQVLSWSALNARLMKAVHNPLRYRRRLRTVRAVELGRTAARPLENTLSAHVTDIARKCVTRFPMPEECRSESTAIRLRYRVNVSVHYMLESSSLHGHIRD